jgi:type IV secretion system protein VirB9
MTTPTLCVPIKGARFASLVTIISMISSSAVAAVPAQATPAAAPASAKPDIATAKTPASSPTPVATAMTVTPVGATQVSEPTSKSHRHHHHHRDPGAGSDGLVQTANARARSFPTSSAYVNSTLYYDFEPGRLYQVETSPRFLTAVMLKPGEKLISKASGDTVRWVMGETAEGAGPTARVIILIKPIQGGLRTNMVLSTDQRTYLIEASSREGSTYSSALSWNYPRDEMQALAVAQARSADMTVASGVSLDQLHFGYRIEPQQSHAPRWQPVRAFDDGTKTFIQFPANMAATDAPPLFLVGAGGKAELVNYRYLNGYYVVDHVIDVAELRLGEKSQTIVRITRTKDRG